MELPPAWSSIELSSKSPFFHVTQWNSVVALPLSEHAYLQDQSVNIAVNIHLLKLSLT